MAFLLDMALRLDGVEDPSPGAGSGRGGLLQSGMAGGGSLFGLPEDHEHGTSGGSSSLAVEGGGAVFGGTLLPENETELVATWLRKVLRVWEADLDSRVHDDIALDDPKSTASRLKKFDLRQFKETKLCLKPLRRMLNVDTAAGDKKPVGAPASAKQDGSSPDKAPPPDQKTASSDGSTGLLPAIREKLASMIRDAETRQYDKVNNTYMKLAIGNAAWPLGVTSVGIHERKAHDAISDSHVAHVLSDEATRKYIHAFKRLMTYCQERWPR